MGQDGKSAGTLSQRGIARDAYGYTLGYFNGDYQPIGGSSSNFELSYAGSTFANSDSSLYNGNIRQIVAHNKQLGAARGHSYRYDQLHRIRKGRIWEYNDIGTHSWVGTGTATNKHLTAYQYDPNGNLTNLIRYDDSPLIIDNLGYGYYDGTNQLSKVGDGHSGPEGVASGQPNNNYHYDENGNLIIDLLNNDDIAWTHFNKVKRVWDDGTFSRQVLFAYGPDQNRWVKASSAAFVFHTRDANGNILATYEHTASPSDLDTFILVWKDAYIYGSSRIGVVHPGLSYEGLWNNPTVNNLPDSSIFTADSVSLCFGWRSYEIANHLGNVTATVSDRKRPIDTNADGIADYYEPTILSATDYYPFGMDMPNRTYSSNDYRFGFNGKEVDRNGEWGSLNHYDYGFRIYNPGIAKFLSVDPLRREYPSWTPYAFAMNRVIDGVDLDGLEWSNSTRAKNDTDAALLVANAVGLAWEGLNNIGLRVASNIYPQRGQANAIRNASINNGINIPWYISDEFVLEHFRMEYTLDKGYIAVPKGNILQENLSLATDVLNVMGLAGGGGCSCSKDSNL